MNVRFSWYLFAGAWFAAVAHAQSLAPDIVVTKTLDVPVAVVWNAWTSIEGIESFFAPKAAKVEARPEARSSCGLRLTPRQVRAGAMGVSSTASSRWSSS